MSEDYSETTESTDTSDISSDVSDSTDMTDYSSDDASDDVDLSDDGSDYIPDDDSEIEVEDADTDNSENFTSEESDKTDETDGEAEESGIETDDSAKESENDTEDATANEQNDDSSDDASKENDSDLSENPDGVDNLPNEKNNPRNDFDILDEDGNLKVMNNEDYSALSKEQQDAFEKKYEELSPDEQIEYDKQFAQAQLDSYYKHVGNGDYEKNDDIERDLKDTIDGKYSGDDNLDSAVTGIAAKVSMSAVGSALGLDPAVKSDLSDKVGEIGRTHGPQAIDAITATAYAQQGSRIPNPQRIYVPDKNGVEHTELLENYNPSDNVAENDNNKDGIHQRDTNSDTAQMFEQKKADLFKNGPVLKAGQDFEGSGKSVFELKDSNAGQIKLPKNGEWSGVKGDSSFYPTDQESGELLNKYGQDHIDYKNNQPDFSPFEVQGSNVRINDFGQNRTKNFSAADTAFAEKNGMDKRDVRDMRKGNYTWHEKDSKGNMSLVPTEIHSKFAHSGGIAETKKSQIERANDEINRISNVKPARNVPDKFRRLKG